MAEAMQTRATANGRGHAPVPAFAVASAMPYDDPMSKVLGLDAKVSGLAAWFGFGSAGTLLMVWLMALTLFVAWWRATHVTSSHDTMEEIEILKEEAPPPPPPVVEPETKPQAAPARTMPHEPPPPPPAPAQAAKVLTAETKPDEPLDLTGNTIVTGNADTFAGGFTASNGTNANAVHTMPGPQGVPGGTGTPQVAAPPPPGPDLSRAASLSGGTQWSCPFPPEADTAQVDEAFVSLRVEVRPDGTPVSVSILQDPGNGFGREARRCAMNKHYQAALDHDGTAIAGTWKARVHFSR
jgi:protein TonB